MKILIAEDNLVNAKIIMSHLKAAGYETLLAQSGKEAMSLLDSEPSVELVIADIMMPEMDGLELLRSIKARRDLKDIPVIMCSALSDMETVKKAAKEGCRGYIVKPVLKQHLLRKVKEVLSTNREVLSDRKKVMRHLGLREDDYLEIAGDFKKMLEMTIAGLEQADKDRKAAHCAPEKLSNLHENAVYLGAERLLAVLEEAEANRSADAESRHAFGDLLIRELKMVFQELTAILKPAPKRKA